MNESSVVPSDASHVNHESTPNVPIVLTDRDIEIMRLIHEQRYLVFSQIKDAFWPGSSNESNAAHRRLRRLADEEYLGKEYVVRRSMNLYLLAQRGYEVLQDRKLDSNLQLYRFNDDTDRRYVDHNLKVTNIRLVFRGLGLGDWTSERIIHEKDRPQIMPDGVVKIRGDKIAVEYENGLKSRQRYVSRFDAYKNAGDYTLVIYVVGSVAMDWLVELDAYKLDQVCFVQYHELLRKKGEARLENKASGFPLAELA